MMFLGKFEAKLLPSNQFVLPAKLRNALKTKDLIIAKGFDNCIYGLSVEEWEKIASQELLKPLLSEEGRRMRQKVFSQAEQVDFDKQGRFVLPEYMLVFAKIKDQIIIIGAGDHFEIWDKDEWTKLKNV